MKKQNYKGMKMLLFLLILSMVIFFVGFSMSENITVENISVTGEKMKIQDYKDVYGKPFNERKSKDEIESFENISIQINSVVVNDNKIELDYQIGEYKKKISGSLYNSRRNMDNIVAVFDSDEECDILFFEIVKGTQEVNLLYNTLLNGQPHIKIYLRDSLDYIYLFETNLPELFKNINISTSEECDVYKDYLWYLKIVDGYEVDNSLVTEDYITIGMSQDETEQIKRNIAIAANKPYEEILDTYSTTSSNVRATKLWGGKVYKMETTNGVDETTHYFYPHGQVRIMKVTSEGENRWWATLEISEHTSTKMIGSTSEADAVYGVNRFCVRNIEMASVCGNATAIVESKFSGTAKEYHKFTNDILKTTGDTIGAIFFEKVCDTPVVNTAATIMSWLLNITDNVCDTVVLGAANAGSQLVADELSGVRIDVGDYYLNKYTEATNGHIFKLHVMLSGLSNTIATTTGAFKINYDVYTDILTYNNSHEKIVQFYYSDDTASFEDGYT